MKPASVHKSAAWLLVGFLTMFLLQRFLPFHHHDAVEGNPLEPCEHAHSLAERSARNLDWFGVALGLSFHTGCGPADRAIRAHAGRYPGFGVRS